ncbi:chain-length determining protein [Arthrobacter sp. H35-D1]|uniref:chain-length determining protein n=1 Tax=Arthrobacter sp. H35-D1 TaxID=3046202 RepID=UPI0024BA09CD|nr:chain-length determining protein [Arthrobacter sp. H35-D1]MDJ0312312.1 chain-length determining protein [Arthrobacter sp. H35-D1]
MDPLSVARTLWHHKLILIPVVLVTLLAAAYIFALGPRTYQSTATFALVNPLVPTEQEILKDPSLGKLNSNNPYLRSSDNTLVAQALTTRLGTQEVAKLLEMKGLGTEYSVERAGSFGTGLMVQINAIGSSPDQAMSTVDVLGEFLVQELEAMQEINGADKRFLFTALAVTSGDQATEQFSSRLRSVIMIGAGGVVLLFASVSAAQALDRRREAREKLGNLRSRTRGDRNRRADLSAEHGPDPDREWDSRQRKTADTRQLIANRKEDYLKRQSRVGTKL